MFEDRTRFADAQETLAEADLAAGLRPLETLLPALATVTVPVKNAGFEFPARLWGAMIACYAVFFAAITAATGGSGTARFAIVISILYTAMYFGLARIGARQAGPEARSPLDLNKPLMTWTGPMNAGSVYSQVLVVPMTLAIFGTGIALIVALAI